MAFTGRSERISISLPEDMVSYLRERARQEDRSLSKVISRAIVADAMNHAERLTAERAEYTTGGDDA